MSVTIKLNGRNKSLADRMSVLDLLGLLGILPRGVIIERNQKILGMNSIDQVTLEDGDEVEIIRIVGGG